MVGSELSKKSDDWATNKKSVLVLYVSESEKAVVLAVIELAHGLFTVDGSYFISNHSNLMVYLKLLHITHIVIVGCPLKTSAIISIPKFPFI